jgi:hypothetical protein
MHANRIVIVWNWIINSLRSNPIHTYAIHYFTPSRMLFGQVVVAVAGWAGCLRPPLTLMQMLLLLVQ